MDFGGVVDLFKQLSGFFGGFKDVFGGLNSILSAIGDWAGLTTKKES